MSEVKSENSKPGMKNLLWMEMLWEGANTTAQEEHRKEEVLALFRGLVRDSKREQEVHEYVPWRPLW